MAVPAEPAPLTTIFKSSMFLLTILSAFIKPDKTIIAVPCWSSWNTGIFNLSFNFFTNYSINIKKAT